jgi:hypothetical protein
MGVGIVPTPALLITEVTTMATQPMTRDQVKAVWDGLKEFARNQAPFAYRDFVKWAIPHPYKHQTSTPSYLPTANPHGEVFTVEAPNMYRVAFTVSTKKPYRVKEISWSAPDHVTRPTSTNIIDWCKASGEAYLQQFTVYKLDRRGATYKEIMTLHSGLPEQTAKRIAETRRGLVGIPYGSGDTSRELVSVWANKDLAGGTWSVMQSLRVVTHWGKHQRAKDRMERANDLDFLAMVWGIGENLLPNKNISQPQRLHAQRLHKMGLLIKDKKRNWIIWRVDVDRARTHYPEYPDLFKK